MKRKYATSFRLSDEAKHWLSELAELKGMSKNSTLENLIRDGLIAEKAKQRIIEGTPDDHQ
jgi:predicted transcriptional regulator